MGAVDRSRSDVAAGALNTVRQTGSAIGVALFGALLTGGGFLTGAHLSLAIAAGLAVLIAALAPLLRPRQAARSRPRVRDPDSLHPD